MPSKTRTKWQMKVLFLDACNCDWGCPCQFMAQPTHGNCEGIGAFHIKTGKHGDVNLDGLNMAMAASWPGAIHEGHGRGAFYVDDRATSEQYDALSKIMTGEAGGGPFEIYASTMDNVQKPRRARITFTPKGLTSKAKVDDIIEAQLEPMRNPVTGDVHRAIIELPTGFEANRMELASLKKLVVDDGKLSFKYSGTYGSIQETLWKGP